RMRRIYAERHDALCDAAGRRLRGLLEVARGQSGLHTIGHLRERIPERAAAQAALARGVTVSTIDRFALARVPARGLVLGFGGVRPPEIEAGVDTLAEVLGALARGCKWPATRTRMDLTNLPRAVAGLPPMARRDAPCR
ncbi:MAG TPA: hypothetical protein PLM09_08005, partial [Casimicrobiaceae bacterium]|nr:hypothetical protein [Casimicrobiaceae bacterium]